jgi:hypothetical protein
MKPGNGKQVKRQRLHMPDCLAIVHAVQNNHVNGRSLPLQGAALLNP